jgi:2-(1,2-epoxy-1,2-dihydrophenyl)acetyl-CoA isomerase
MAFTKIEVQTVGGVGIIRLNDPGALNALSLPMVEETDGALTMLSGSVRALILTGAGRAFCSGANLTAGIGGTDVPGEVPDFGLVLQTHINPLMKKLRDLSIPWLSAVRGAAAGVGCSLALAADMVIASESAYFLQAFSRIGLVPDGGSTHLLVRAVGRVRALEMMLLGERLPAARALDWGLVNRVVADDALDGTALAMAERLAQGPTQSLRMTRRLAWTAIDADWSEALQAERDAQKTAGRTHDAREGIAAFVEKRAARFEGR